MTTMMRPGELKRGDVVSHDNKPLRGVVVRVFDKRGDKGIPVEYAEIRPMGQRTQNVEHPTFVLTKS